MKTKIKFSDIAGMLERDEMKEIVGGSAYNNGGGNTFSSGTALGGGFSGGSGSNFDYSAGLTSGSGGMSTSEQYSYTYGSGYLASYNAYVLLTSSQSGQYTTTDPKEINAIFAMLYGSSDSYGYNNTQQGRPPMDCVFQCLGWVSLMLGDTKHDSKYYENMYAFTNSSGSTNALYNFLTGSGGGIPQNQVLNFASKFFNATDYSGASSQFLAKYINPSTNPNGNNQLIGIYRNDTTGGLHAVTVTSIVGNQVNFFDPQNGNTSSIDISKMNSFIGISK
jgi:hypothetical protein